MTTQEFEQIIINKEIELHKAGVRKNRQSLNEYLHNDFLEIGISGKIYKKEDVLDSLPLQVHKEFTAYDFIIRKLEDNLYQLIYETEKDEKKSLRSSIWINKNGVWTMLFHQGTKLN